MSRREADRVYERRHPEHVRERDVLLPSAGRFVSDGSEEPDGLHPFLGGQAGFLDERVQVVDHALEQESVAAGSGEYHAIAEVSSSD